METREPSDLRPTELTQTQDDKNRAARSPEQLARATKRALIFCPSLFAVTVVIFVIITTLLPENFTFHHRQAANHLLFLLLPVPAFLVCVASGVAISFSMRSRRWILIALAEGCGSLIFLGWSTLMALWPN